MDKEALWIDLDGIELEDVEILSQEGSHGIPEFAASSCSTCSCGQCSCGQDGSLDGIGGG